MAVNEQLGNENRLLHHATFQLELSPYYRVIYSECNIYCVNQKCVKSYQKLGDLNIEVPASGGTVLIYSYI